MRLLLFRIKSQPDVAYQSVTYKKARDIVLSSSKREEVIFTYEFIFVFTPISLGRYC